MEFHQTNNNQGDVINVVNPEVYDEVITQEEMSRIIEFVDTMVKEGGTLVTPKEKTPCDISSLP